MKIMIINFSTKTPIHDFTSDISNFYFGFSFGIKNLWFREREFVCVVLYRVTCTSVSKSVHYFLFMNLVPSTGSAPRVAGNSPDFGIKTAP